MSKTEVIIRILLFDTIILGAALGATLAEVGHMTKSFVVATIILDSVAFLCILGLSIWLWPTKKNPYYDTDLWDI